MRRGSTEPLVLALFVAAGCWGGGEGPQAEGEAGRGLRLLSGAELDEEGVAWVRFGEVPVGEASSVSLVLLNDSTAALPISYSDLEPPFLVSRAPRELSAGEAAELTLRFQPLEEGIERQQLELHSERGRLRFDLEGEGLAVATCHLVASPAHLRFTALPAGPGLVREGSVRIAQEGEAACSIEGVKISGSSAFDTTVSTPRVVPAGGGLDVPVRYDGEEGAEAELVVVTPSGELRVPLGTKEENDCLLLEEGDGALSVIGAGCGPGVVAMENRCGSPLAVSAGASVAFSVEGSLRTIAAGEVLTLEMGYQPSSMPWERDGALFVQASNGDLVRQALRGTLDWRDETITPRPDDAVDLLFVLDVGESLVEFQDKLDEIATYWSREMETSLDIDYRVQATTTSIGSDGDCDGEAGALIPPGGSRPQTVAWDTPDRDSVLLENLRAPACASSSGAGLAAIEAAVGDGWPEWRKADELRVVLFSVGDDASPMEVDYYRSLFSQETENGRFLDSLTLVIPSEACNDLPIPQRYRGLEGFAFISSLCASSGPVFDPPVWPFMASLSGRPLDLGGDEDYLGVEVFIDDEPLLEDWSLSGDQLIVQRSYVKRGTRIQVRYPLDCR